MSQPSNYPAPAAGSLPEAAGPSTAPPVAPPGWYPDPQGAPVQRYHDGTRWTSHTAQPAQPAPPQQHGATGQASMAQAVAVTVQTGAGPNHALHAVLTIVTCGAWLPVWILIAVFGRR